MNKDNSPEKREYNGPYSGPFLNYTAFPLGGTGAGMICLEGTGAFSHVSLRHRPGIFEEPSVFAALSLRGSGETARVLEGPVPTWKIFGPAGAGNGARGKHYGLSRFARAEFEARFPFGLVRLNDPGLPVRVEITGWSPFIPGNADDSGLPVSGLEYRIINSSDKPVEAVFSFHAVNFMAKANGYVLGSSSGFTLGDNGSGERPWDKGAVHIEADDPGTRVNSALFRGGWFDSLTLIWKSIQDGEMPEAGPFSEGEPSPGGSLYVPLELAAYGERTVSLRLSWYVPRTNLRFGEDPETAGDSVNGRDHASNTGRETYTPWYAGRFKSIEEVNADWAERYDALREASKRFSDCFFDTTLPPEVVEAIAANLTILKSPTILRQEDGRLWCWEGCSDNLGCCAGSCTHVWNYAQALPHLFPDLERSLRETEFNESQDERGHQVFRASLPIRRAVHDFHSASDGQLGGIMKAFREWRISGDTDWLKKLWPRIKQSLAYCISEWDPDHEGILREPHHNTYDIEFWGPDGMGASFYLGALSAAIRMAEELDDDVSLYKQLLSKGRAYMENNLFDGDYFIQQVQWKGLRSPDPADNAVEKWNTSYSPEARELLEKEGPKYQYGKGCLSDGVLGVWMAEMCGLEPFLDIKKVDSHLLSVFGHNFKRDLSGHANPQRPGYALGREAGLLLCSWPKGGMPTLPFVYSNEVWTGIEYQAASHIMLMGHVEKGLEIVRAARDRYDGRVRNPFDEYECGHWYARALSSYGMLRALTGVRYDRVDKTLTVAPRVKGDFRAFLSAATGYGTAGVKDGEPFLEVKAGEIEVDRIDYLPFVSEEPE